MSQSKLEKLRLKLTDAKKKQKQLDKTIKNLNSQILEEETKGFQSTLKEMSLSYEDAMELLRGGNRPSVSDVAQSFTQGNKPMNDQYGEELEQDEDKDQQDQTI